jgi:hypothetical protein
MQIHDFSNQSGPVGGRGFTFTGRCCQLKGVMGGLAEESAVVRSQGHTSSDGSEPSLCQPFRHDCSGGLMQRRQSSVDGGQRC